MFVVLSYRTLPLFLCAVLLCGCAAEAGALPPVVSPFPTLARLPTVTPITPTPIPSPTILLPTITATSIVLITTVAVSAANIRTGPGIQYPIVSSVSVGEPVRLQGQYQGWYYVYAQDQTNGWMAAHGLQITSQIATIVPIREP